MKRSVVALAALAACSSVMAQVPPTPGVVLYGGVDGNVTRASATGKGSVWQVRDGGMYVTKIGFTGRALVGVRELVPVAVTVSVPASMGASVSRRSGLSATFSERLASRSHTAMNPTTMATAITPRMAPPTITCENIFARAARAGYDASENLLACVRARRLRSFAFGRQCEGRHRQRSGGQPAQRQRSDRLAPGRPRRRILAPARAGPRRHGRGLPRARRTAGP